MNSKIFGERPPDVFLLVTALSLVLLGVAMVFSSSHRLAETAYGDPLFFLKKELLFVIAGIVLMVVTSRLPLQKMRPLIYPSLLVLGILLVFVFFPQLGGKDVKGAARWIRLGPFSLQVSELVKLAVVIFLADYLARKGEFVGEFWRGLIVPMGILFPLLALILLEPDYGSVVIICAVALTLLFLGGVKKRHLVAIGAPIAALGVFLLVSQPYRVARMVAFSSPWENRETSGFQIVQSLMSFGSGGAFGVGIGDGLQKLYYLPEAHTDFILSIIAEEAGLFGVSLILLLFCVLISRGILIALRSPDRFYSLLAAGVTLLFGAQAVVNIASAMGLMPPKGLALPLVSYGGTALLVNMVAVGILLNVSMSTKEKPLKKLLGEVFNRREEQHWKGHPRR